MAQYDAWGRISRQEYKERKKLTNLCKQVTGTSEKRKGWNNLCSLKPDDGTTLLKVALSRSSGGQAILPFLAWNDHIFYR